MLWMCIENIKAKLMRFQPYIMLKSLHVTDVSFFQTVSFIQGVFWLWHHKELKYHQRQGYKRDIVIHNWKRKKFNLFMT